MKEYKVKVFDNGTKKWYLDGKRHREDGPANEGVYIKMQSTLAPLIFS